MKKLNTFLIISLCNLYQNQIYIPYKTTKKLSELKTDFYYGLNNQDLKSSEQIFFDIDFHYSSVIVNKMTLCEVLNNCRILNEKIYNKSSYKNELYYYNKIKTFFGLNNQITTTITQNQLFNYINLPIRKLNENHEQFSNVLGLSINSPVWQHWVDLYNFKNDIIHFDIVLQNNNEQIIFWNIYWPLKHTWLPASKRNERYQWNMVVHLDFNNSTPKEFITIFTFENDKNLLFEVRNETYILLMSELCIDIENCTKKEHLRSDIDLKQIQFKGSEDSYQIIDTEELYEIQEDDTIKFYFQKFLDWDKKVDIVLQNRFFQKYYISISNNLQNQRFYFLKINHLDTLKVQFQNEYIKLVLSFLLMSLLITLSYAIYSKLYVRKKVLKDLDRDIYQQIN